MSDPRVVAVCPIRNRAWIVEEHAAALAGQRGRALKNTFYLTGDNEDDTFDRLAKVTRTWSGVRYSVFDTGSPHWHRSRPGEKYTGDDHANLAAVYNELLDRALARFDASHFWLLDSDVLPEPDCLEKLLEVDEPIVSAVVEHSPGVYNFMLGRGRDDGAGGEPRRLGCESDALGKDGRLGNPFLASFVSCCTLFRRGVLELHDTLSMTIGGVEHETDRRPAVRFAPHPRSQDFPFCARAEAAGFRLWVQPAAHAEHRMEEPEDA